MSVDQVRLEVPEGWEATRLRAADRAAAVSRVPDRTLAAPLRDRLRGLANQGGLMYLFDYRHADRGDTQSVEVYRYRSREPRAVLQKSVLPRLKAAGLRPVIGHAYLVVGKAVTVSSRTTTSGLRVHSKIVLVAFGGRVVGLSATQTFPAWMTTPPPSEIERIIGSLRRDQAGRLGSAEQ